MHPGGLNPWADSSGGSEIGLRHEHDRPPTCPVTHWSRSQPEVGGGGVGEQFRVVDVTARVSMEVWPVVAMIVRSEAPFLEAVVACPRRRE